MAVFIFGRSQAPSLFPERFADTTWEDIVKACHMNKVPDTWVVGDSKSMTINGVEYQIDIIGKWHDTYSDGTGFAPLTFQLRDCYGTTNYKMNLYDVNAGSWQSSNMRYAILPAILAVMPTEVQAAIREVNKLTGAAGAGATAINTTNDKLFLLSEVEVMGYNPGYNRALDGEGAQYEYYLNGGSKVKALNNTDASWWTRSPEKNSNTAFCFFSTTGASYGADADKSYGVSFAFCF